MTDILMMDDEKSNKTEKSKMRKGKEKTNNERKKKQVN